MKPALAITWFEHRRMTGLCGGLGIRLHELVSRKRGMRRYAELIPRTFGLIRSQRPDGGCGGSDRRLIPRTGLNP